MHIGLIVKVSKLCNLRCTYCCEGAELANPRRMRVENIGAMFRAVAGLLRQVGPKSRHKVTFYWHGGEPFVQPIAYWNEILNAQQQVFANLALRVRILNAVQSNLTTITPAHLPLLKHFRLGFSFDVMNRLRVFAGGQDSAQRVISTVEWLTRCQVPLAGIVVVSRATVDHPDAVAEFYLSRRLPFRFIQLDEGLEHLPAVAADRVSFDQYLAFARALFTNAAVQRALVEGLRIDPITMAAQACEQNSRRSKPALSLRECAEREHLLEVNTDGEVYSTADYPYRNWYGNIFTDSIEQLLLSDSRRHRIEQSAQRLEEVCSGCELFRRVCNGTWVAHATRAQYEEFRRHGGCELRVIAGWMAPVARRRHRAHDGQHQLSHHA